MKYFSTSFQQTVDNYVNWFFYSHLTIEGHSHKINGIVLWNRTKYIIYRRNRFKRNTFFKVCYFCKVVNLKKGGFLKWKWHFSRRRGPMQRFMVSAREWAQQTDARCLLQEELRDAKYCLLNQYSIKRIVLSA